MALSAIVLKVAVLVAVCQLANSEGIKDLESSFNRWKHGFEVNAKTDALETAKLITAKLGQFTPDTFFTAEALEEIRKPLKIDWEKSKKVKIVASEKGTEISSPFFVGELEGVDVQQAKDAVADLITRDIAAASRNQNGLETFVGTQNVDVPLSQDQTVIQISQS